GGRRSGRRAARGSVADERPRRPARRDARRPGPLRPRAVDARGRARRPADRGRLHHRRARPRGGEARRPGAAPHRDVPARQGTRGRMRIAVIGCGAVGSLFAANLGTLDDVEVWAYDPWREHVDAINANGLRLSGAGEVLGRVRATADPQELLPCELGIVAVKSMQTAEAITATAHAFADGAVCSVQNGAGNEELIAEHVHEVIRGTTFPAGHVIEPGHVGWDTKGDTHVGPFEPSPAPMEKVEALADACTRAGMPTHALADARGAQWRKLIFNAASNAIAALTGRTHGQVAEPPTRELAWAVMAE